MVNVLVLSRQSDFVCRVPLYMQYGLMRVRLRRTGMVTLTAEQLKVVQQTHQILSRLSVDINKPINFDLNFDNDLLSFYSSAPLSTAPNGKSGSGKSNADEESSNIPIDPFSELHVDPLKARVCGLLLIVRLPGEASLVNRAVF